MIGKNRAVEIGIIADIGQSLQQIQNECFQNKIKPFKTEEWLAELIAARNNGKEMLKSRMNSKKIPIHPDRLIAEVYKSMNPEDILVIDGGDTAVLALAQVDFHVAREPRTYLQSIGSGHLGVCIPWLIGAKLGHLDSKVFGITGDGSFMFNVQELDVAVRNSIPFVLVVADNCSWGMIEHVSHRKFGKKRESYFCDIDTDYVKISEGFGCYSERVEDPDKIKNAIQRGIDSKKPAVIVVSTKKVAPMGTKLMLGFNELKF
jgi:thiamine pyrophosphate-dependent acetolactate synthase large subunit-like protein